MKQKVLIIDDEPSICITLMLAMKRKYEAQYSTSVGQALQLLKNENFNLVFLDLRIGEDNGLDVLKDIKALDSTIAVIMMTAFGTIDSSVEAMKNGAFTYLSKPINIEEAMIYAEQALHYRSLNEQVLILRDELQTGNRYHGMVGLSPAMRKVYQLIEKVKDIDIGVTITGESGTGKELVARAIHYSGTRSKEKFITVNCAAIPEGLLEEELFGHRKGAFTGAISDTIGKFKVADQGTIFLDEIGDLPLAMQGKLLRVIQEKSYTPIGSSDSISIDVRIIAATNHNLTEMVHKGSFRLDLFYRINVMNVELPPLRERRQDILLLCDHFIDMYNKEQHKNIQGLTKGAQRLLLEYDYPGNIRELSNILEYAVAICDTDIIHTTDLPRQAANLALYCTQMDSHANASESFRNLTIREIEKAIIIDRLGVFHGHQVKTAESLGISVKGLRNKMHAYGLYEKNYES
ncbi:MAG: sigma-54 dependent transcriptional regulator [Sphaerochaetaceae bacterium]|nr:sigma-54 dependent transcriptional regulator [Sphaerochaetaceae bacterium]